MFHLINAIARGRIALFLAAASLSFIAYADADDRLCGVRAVARILEHHDKKVDLVELLKEFPEDCRRRGTSVAEIATILRNHGLHATVTKERPGGLRQDGSAICWSRASHASHDGHYYTLLPSGADFCFVWDGMPCAAERFAASDTHRVYIVVSAGHRFETEAFAANALVILSISALLASIVGKRYSTAPFFKRKPKCTES